MESSIIGEKIAKARKKVNLSQAQLSEMLFISPQAIGKWERGESIPDIVTINKLAKILGVDLNYFSENSQSQNDPVITEVKNNNVASELKTGQVEEPSVMQERDLLTNFSGNALSDTDFSGVQAHKRKFNGSDLRGAD